jgi:hypothetical protein
MVKRDIAYVIKLRVLKWVDYQDYPGRSNAIAPVVRRGKQEECQNDVAGESLSQSSLTLKMENEGMTQE